MGTAILKCVVRVVISLFCMEHYRNMEFSDWVGQFACNKHPLFRKLHVPRAYKQYGKCIFIKTMKFTVYLDTEAIPSKVLEVSSMNEVNVWKCMEKIDPLYALFKKIAVLNFMKTKVGILYEILRLKLAVLNSVKEPMDLYQKNSSVTTLCLCIIFSWNAF